MSAFSVEATLKLRDETAPGIRSINKAVQGLLANAKKFEGLNGGAAATNLTTLRQAYASAAKGASQFARAGNKVERSLGSQALAARDMARQMRAAADASRKFMNPGASGHGKTAFGGIDVKGLTEARANLDRLGNSYGRAAAQAALFAKAVQQGNSAFGAMPKGFKPQRTPSMTPDWHPRSPNYGRRYGRGYQTPMEAAGHSASYGVVHGVQNMLSVGGRQAVDADTAKAGLGLRGLDKGKQTEVIRAAEELAKEFKAVPMGDMIEALGDAMLQAKDMANFKALARLTASNAQIFTIARGSTEEGKRASQIIGKIVDSIGKADDPKEAAAYSEAIAKAMIQNGKDTALPTFIAIARGLKDAKFGQSPEGLAKILNLGDELGQRVGNEAAQLQAFLNGAGKKESQAGLKKLGFVDDKGKFTGREKAGKDMLGWVIDDLAPAMQKQGVDTSNTGAVNEFLRKQLKVKDTISDIIATVIAKQDEVRRGEQQRKNMDMTDARASKLTNESLAASGEALKSNFGHLSDALVSKVTPALLGMGDAASTVMQKATEAVRSNDVSPVGAGGAVVGGAGIIGGGLARAGGAVAERLGLTSMGKMLEVAGKFGLKWGGAVGVATTAMEGFTFLLKKASEDRQAEIKSGSPLGKMYADADKRRNERGERQRAIVRALGERAAEAVTGQPANTLPTFANAGTPGNPLSVQIDKIRSDFMPQKNGVFRPTMGGIESKDGPGFQANMPPTMANLNELVMKIDAEFAKLDPAAAKFGAAIDSIPGKGTAFGQAAGSTLVSQGAAFGQAAAAAFNANAKVPAGRQFSSGYESPGVNAP